ncbi:MAG: beta-ketoacyl synthase N-terminal-like domain-containing protein [Pseudomonadota bacterium]
MSAQPIAIAATGMVTGVGLSASASCAAIRAGIDNFQETRFKDVAGEFIQGCEVQLERPWQGVTKLSKMLARAIAEACAELDLNPDGLPVLVCLAEKERPGWESSHASKVFFQVQEELGIRFNRGSALIQHGRIGGLVALQQAQRLLYESDSDVVLVAGVDSLLSGNMVKNLERNDRVLTSLNSDGFVPGEGASALAVKRPLPGGDSQLVCRGLGFGVEWATIDSHEPLRGDGLVSAVTSALSAAERSMDDMSFRIVDVSGEHYWFKEAALVLARLLRRNTENAPLWHVADCVGEVGSAVVGVSLSYVKSAFEKNFAPGFHMLVHGGNDNGQRGAAVFEFMEHS